jgi:hypothetical protein
MLDLATTEKRLLTERVFKPLTEPQGGAPRR